MDWKPIETAPKDGWILGWAPGWIPVTMCWEDTRPLGGRAGWFVGGRGSQYIPATHWQPLPSEPVTDALNENDLAETG